VKKILMVLFLSFMFMLGAAGEAWLLASRHCVNVLLCETMRQSIADWDQAIEPRFPGAVVVFCHGGDVNGEWCLHPDHWEAEGNDAVRVADPPIPVEAEVLVLQKKYPGRWIVLITCNPSHHFLSPSIHHVVYSLTLTWVDPDSIAAPTRHVVAPDMAAGSVNQMIVAD
jgi:hypothetical protein